MFERDNKELKMKSSYDNFTVLEKIIHLNSNILKLQIERDSLIIQYCKDNNIAYNEFLRDYTSLELNTK